MLKLVLASGAALLAFSSPALAQQQPPQSSLLAGGVRVEARVGMEDFSLLLDVDGPSGMFTAEGSEQGLVYGGEVGFDAVVGSSVLLGAYAGAELSRTESCGPIYGLDEACLRAGRSFTAGFRAGALLTPRTLLYGKAGYSNGQLKLDYIDFENILDPIDEEADRGGVHVGAGIEYEVTRNGFIKAEYVHTFYDSYEVMVDGDRVRLDGDRDQGFVGLGVRF